MRAAGIIIIINVLVVLGHQEGMLTLLVRSSSSESGVHCDKRRLDRYLKQSTSSPVHA